MGSDKRIRFAVIGAGLIGPRHAQTVMENPDTELVAIVDPLESNATLARDLDIAHYQSLHVPLAKQLASAGVHVLVEKPVSVDITSGKDLARHVSATGVLVSSGTLGTIVAVNGLWALRKPDEYFQHPPLDLLHFLFGPITSVHAEKTLSQRGFEADEGAALTLRFRSGVVGSFVLADTDFYRIPGTDGSLGVPDMRIMCVNCQPRLDSAGTKEMLHISRGSEAMSITGMSHHMQLG
ncbi:quinate utilization oxidoreductase QutH [Verticillium dahliae VdLs.17]|uniref:Quinate utilization oxidoreductase QutH n=1 Tax=Verticillium dahliae (strain VdLs.17 / ATCC MYA-4575 / FGSC 10137) TaxID=498257 RepID=G2XCG6_VERDV|nr:quinate utilization oxidoreductase QutH [Verticillium dahliae VdLs.17]EGY16684.1 quinate utilization oxidoreductase QutH [Verticillium dahliae VdLs.17]